jgi:hypothetical protein
MVVVCVMDGTRLRVQQDEQTKTLAMMTEELSAVAVRHHLGFEGLESPQTSREERDVIALVARIVIVAFVFPFTVLSNPAILFASKHRRLLLKDHRSVLIATVLGFVLFLLSVIGLVVGAIARVTYPWYSTDRLVSGEISWPRMNSSEGGCGNWTKVTAEDPHSLCTVWVSNWSLLQLAALPILAESQLINITNPEVLRHLACLTEVPLIQDDPDVAFPSKSIIAFDSVDGKRALGMPSIGYDRNFGLYWENFLTSYYHILIRTIVPIYSIAYSSFLSGMLTTTGEVLVSAILGPNQVSVSSLNLANLTAGVELELASDVLNALHLSVNRPVVVGHGGNGLLVKALAFSYDPWRISFEAPSLADSPMAALAGTNEVDSRLSRILNFHGVDSIYAQSDDMALMNHRIPKYGLSNLIPPNPFETFCFTAAACGMDDRFDTLCNDVLGEERFSSIWTDLRRWR